MAIFYQTTTIEKEEDAEFDYLLLFKPTTKAVDFYFLGAWEQEPNGIKNKEAFITYLDEKLKVLNRNNNL